MVEVQRAPATLNGERDRPVATVVIVPWQHFWLTRACLESVYAFTPQPFELIYVDGNSPRRVRSYLEREARRRNFTLLRSNRYLTSSEAHNLALPYVSGDYVAFIDNGTLVSPGWLESLLDCARETGAWAVGPLYCNGDLRNMRVYSAAPDLRIVEDNGKRRLHETAPGAGKLAADVRGSLQRSPCGYVKSHCLLTTKAVLDRYGPFDEAYTNYQDSRDFCLWIQENGGSIYFEPRAIAVIVTPPPFAWGDLPMYLLRWSDAWLQPSIRHFARRWRIDADDYMLLGGVRFRDVERRKLFHLLIGAAYRLGGRRGAQAARRLVDYAFSHVLEPTIVKRLERERLRSRSIETSTATMPVASSESI